MYGRIVAYTQGEYLRGIAKRTVWLSPIVRDIYLYTRALDILIVSYAFRLNATLPFHFKETCY
jgi:hypothetical protein